MSTNKPRRWRWALLALPIALAVGLTLAELPMAIHVDESIEVAVPANAVWGFMADLRNEEKWFEGIKSVKLLSGEPGAVGSRYEFVFVAMNTERTAIDTVVELQPDSRIVIQRDPGPVTTRGVATLTTVGSATRVNLVLDAELRGMVRLFGFKIGPAMNNGVKASLRNLKKILEAGLPHASK